MSTKSPPTDQLVASPVTTILVAVCVVVALLLAVSVTIIIVVVIYKRRIHKMSLQVSEMLVIGPIINNKFLMLIIYGTV